MNWWTKKCCILGTSSRVCRNLIYYSTQHEGPPVRGPLFDFWAGDGLFFSHAIFFQTSFLQWLFCFAQNLQTLVTILIYKIFLGPLGYSASAYVMAPKDITTLDSGPEFFSGVRTPALNDYASRRPSCLLESIERLYRSSFIFYTGPQSRYTQRKLGPKAPGWLRKSHGKTKP